LVEACGAKASYAIASAIPVPPGPPTSRRFVMAWSIDASAAAASVRPRANPMKPRIDRKAARPGAVVRAAAVEEQHGRVAAPEGGEARFRRDVSTCE
jgi:hypothetical protein